MIRMSAAAALLLAVSAVSAQQHQFSSAHRDSERSIPQTVATTVADAKSKLKLAANRTGTALVVADFDSDGTPDVISGYSTASGGVLLLQRGSAAAHAPGPSEWAMASAGQFVSPFRPKSEVIDVPVTPDLLATADIAGHGFRDLLIAAKGDSTLYVAFSHGDGSFAAPRAVPLAGAVSALTTWKSRSGDTLAVAAVCGSAGCGLQFLSRTAETLAFVRTPAAVSVIDSGPVDNGSLLDLVYVSNGRAIVLDGDTALAPTPTTEKLPGGNVATVALGSFVTDRRALTQVAVLSTDATLHIFTRAGLDTSVYHSKFRVPATPAVAPAKHTGEPWSEVETVPNVGSGGTPLMVRAHLLVGGNDDLAVLSGNQYVTVAHRRASEYNQNLTYAVVTVDSSNTAIKAAVPARVTADARHSLILLGGGATPLTVSVPGTYKTYTVNTTADGNHGTGTAGLCTSGITCTLRDAVNLANADLAHNISAGTIDTIVVPAGFYSLTVNNPTKGTTTAATYDMFGSYNFHLEIDAPMNIVGSGASTTVIDAGQRDQVISINQGTYNATNYTDYVPAIFDTFISGVTIQNGKNLNAYGSTQCPLSGGYGYCNVEGGNIGAILGAGAGANIVLNNTVVSAGRTGPQGSGTVNLGGGGISVYVDGGVAAGNGPLEIDNSTVSSNTDVSGIGGGGIHMDVGSPLVVSNVLFSSNTTTVVNSNGGAIDADQNDTSLNTITGSTFNSNTAALWGGGAHFNSRATVTNSVFNGNQAGSYGGGVYILQNTYALSITGSTFINNKLTTTYSAGGSFQQDGAGVCIEPITGTTPTFALNYNRFHGNTVTVGGAATGLAIGCNSVTTTSQTTDATNNWWGCNGAATGTGCDTAHRGNVGTGTLTTSPYTQLNLNLSATSVTQGSPITATASLGQNSAGTVYTTAQDAAYLATPITTFTLTNTATPTYTPSATAFSSTAATGTSFAAATATGTTNASGTGTATLTVDGATVTKTYTVIGAADLTVTGTHTGNFKAGDTADTYTLTVGNIGASSTSGTVFFQDLLPNGFTAVSMTGTGWSCTVGTTTCFRGDGLAASGTYPPVTLTVSLSAALAGTYSNMVQVSGGGADANTNNNTSTDSTIVVGQPTISQSFSPATIVAGGTSTVSFTMTNPSGNTIALTGVGFTDILPTGLKVNSSAPGFTVTCTSGIPNGSGSTNSPSYNMLTFSGETIAVGATCTFSASVTAAASGTYTNTTQPVTATNANAGNSASATLTVADATTTTVTLGATTGTVGGSTSLTVTVADTTSPGTTATGTVLVTDTVGGSTFTYGPYTLTNGVYTGTFAESVAGTNVITAAFTPSTSTQAASADATGKTIVIAKATPAAPTGGENQTIQRNVASKFTFGFSYPGTYVPTGAKTVTLNGTTLPVTPVCTYKTTGIAPHANCSFTYTTALPAGQYAFTYSVAADSNYNAITGTSTVTVTP